MTSAGAAPLATFSLDSLSDKSPLRSIATEAIAKGEKVNQNGHLECQLRQVLLAAATDNNNDLASLWKDSVALCRHLLSLNPLAESVRKLPFVLLEDVVDTLPLSQLMPFWQDVVQPTNNLCTGILWEVAAKSSTAHRLHFLKVCNKLLKRLRALSPRHAGQVMMDLAVVLSISDRSAVKIYGSTRAAAAAAHAANVGDDEEDYEFDESLLSATTTTALLDTKSFHQALKALSTDLSNPYKIHDFGSFVKNMQTLLAGLEGLDYTSASGTLSTVSTIPLTSLSPKLLAMKLHQNNASLVLSILIQFLVVEAMLSSQSNALKTSLNPLVKRAYDLIQKLPNGKEHLSQLSWLLEERETMWRTWKRNKCKPDLELPAGTASKRAAADHAVNGTASTTPPPASTTTEFTFLGATNMDDLRARSQAMAAVVPSVKDHLEHYVEALDPEAGIEDEYHPKHDKLYSWQALRLLSNQHLPDFASSLNKTTGDYEAMVRNIYKHQYDVNIPGEGPAEPDMEELIALDQAQSMSVDEKEEEEHQEDQDKVTETAGEKDDGAESADGDAEMQEQDEEAPEAKDDASQTEEAHVEDDAQNGDKMDAETTEQQEEVTVDDTKLVTDGDDEKAAESKQDDEEEDSSQESETEEQREKRYAGMSEFDRAAAEEEDELEQQERAKRKQQKEQEKEAAEKKKVEEEAAAKKKAEEKAAAAKKEAEEEAAAAAAKKNKRKVSGRAAANDKKASNEPKGNAGRGDDNGRKRKGSNSPPHAHDRAVRRRGSSDGARGGRYDNHGGNREEPRDRARRGGPPIEGGHGGAERGPPPDHDRGYWHHGDGRRGSRGDAPPPRGGPRGQETRGDFRDGGGGGRRDDHRGGRGNDDARARRTDEDRPRGRRL